MVDYVKNTVAENFGGVAQKLGTHQFSLELCPDVSGKVAVGTGLSEGIGYGVAFTLLKNNLSQLHVISLNKETMDGAIKDIKERLGEQAADRVKWYECDMADWVAVAETAKKISQSTDRIDMVFNNAGRGIMTYQTTPLGVDRHMAANHVGPVILTSHLLPILKKTAANGNIVRINNQASNLHTSVPKDLKFESLEDLNQDLGPNAQYGRSKLAAILYARYLARHLTSAHPNILANATHPGIVETKMSSEDIHEPFPIAGYGMSAGMYPFKKDQMEGAVSSTYALTTIKESGQYICPPATPESGSEQSQDEKLQEQLMNLTRQLVKDKLPKESVGSGCPLKDY